MLIEITHDVFDICKRLKEINSSYFIVRNTREQRFEVHSRAQNKTTLSLVLPYAELDARTVELVRRTRRERMRELVREMEQHNSKLERSAIARGAERAAKLMGC